jgi:hypothetical protein
VEIANQIPAASIRKTLLNQVAGTNRLASEPGVKQYLIALLSALAATLVYGSWAAYANFEHGRHAWVMAASVQGIYAFISTLSITGVAHWIYNKAGCGNKGIAIGFGASFMVMLAIPISVHSFVGTPDIIQTILPGAIWGAMYLLGYLLVQEKARKGNPDSF